MNKHKKLAGDSRGYGFRLARIFFFWWGEWREEDFLIRGLLNKELDEGGSRVLKTEIIHGSSYYPSLVKLSLLCPPIWRFRRHLQKGARSLVHYIKGKISSVWRAFIKC